MRPLCWENQQSNKYPTPNLILNAQKPPVKETQIITQQTQKSIWANKLVKLY